ncbi:hypothetical protein ACHAPJ_012522 [Fusarium lateritium]
MPLWQIYHPDGAFVDGPSKTLLVKDITRMYEELGLPTFYTVTQFIKLSSGDFYIGNRPNSGNPFIRIVINHIAITIDEGNNASFKSAIKRVNHVLKSHVHDKGYDYEVHVGQTDRRLWQTNGMSPPQFGSSEEATWVSENRPVWYDGA